MSNSSKKLRDELNSSQVENHIPRVDNSVSIIKYFGHANQLYKESVNSYKKGEWQYSYVQLKIFLYFSLHIRRHHAFNLPQHFESKNWLKRANDSAFQMIDVAVLRLDQIEDMVLQQQEDWLNNEFYGSSDEEQAPAQNLSKEQDASPEAESGHDALSEAASDIALDFHAENEHPPMSPSALSGDALSKAFSVLKVEQNGPKGQPTLQLATTERSTDVSYTGDEDILLVRSTLEGVRTRQSQVPAPHRQTLQLNLGLCQFVCNKDDFFVSFTSFLHFLPPELQLFRSVVETNRCFFIHLGVATGFHPFILQYYFRGLAKKILQSLPSDDMQCELLESVLLYAGFVDANVLCLLWPREFTERRYRICFLCGSLTRPMFITFTPVDESSSGRGDPYIDIVIYCDGSHFTILEVVQMSHACSRGGQGGVIDQLMEHAKSSKFIVQEHFVNYVSSIGDFLM